MISGTRYQLTLEIARQQRLAGAIAREQADIATTKRIAAPSDDPTAYTRVAQLSRTSANEATWAANVKTGTARAAQADSTLKTLQSAIDRARELVTAAANDTLNATDRAASAAELRGIAQDLQSYQSVKDAEGQPVFATGDALAIPIAADVQVTAAGSAAQVFGNVATASGPATLVDIVNAAATALETTSDAARRTATGVSLDAIGAAVDHLAGEQAVQGVRESRLDTAASRFADLATSREEERSGLEDTDITETTIRLNADQLSLNAAQSVFARINKNTLFDLLG